MATKAVEETVYNYEYQILIMQNKLAELPSIYEGHQLDVQVANTLNKIWFLRNERNNLAHMYTYSEWRSIRSYAYHHYTGQLGSTM